ncbi:MAG: C39 family peptidase [Chloroflexi bacterium]|nr:C39 family peptidase [Chloroflexota bacterium]
MGRNLSAESLNSPPLADLQSRQRLATSGMGRWLLGLGVIFALLATASYLNVSSSQFDFVAGSSIENEAGAPGKTSAEKVLRVPYLNQGLTNWCYHYALSMVLQYNGKNVTARQIGEAHNHGPQRAMSLLDLILGWVNAYVAQWPELSVEQRLGTGTFEYYKSQIDASVPEPVIVSSYGLPGHTLVVVGYAIEDDEFYLYVHDPSGFLTESTWKTGRKAFAKVSWEQFSRFNWVRLVVRQKAA